MKVKAAIKSGLIILRGKSFRSTYPFTFIYSQNILYKVSYVSKGRLKSFIVSPLSKGQQRIPLHSSSPLMNLLISVFFQGKGKMRTYWLLGEKTDVYVI